MIIHILGWAIFRVIAAEKRSVYYARITAVRAIYDFVYILVGSARGYLFLVVFLLLSARRPWPAALGFIYISG